MRLGYCYIMQREDGLVKIGFTTDLKTRRAALEREFGPLSILRCLNGNRARESELHSKFLECREFGEWFRPTAWMLSEIRALDCGLAASSDRETRGQARREEDIPGNAKVWEMAERLHAICCKNSGRNTGEAYNYIADEYGISERSLRRLINRDARSPSHAIMVRITAAYAAEREIFRQSLLASIDELKADAGDCQEDFTDQIMDLRRRVTEVKAWLH